MESADCPDQICVRQKAISKEGESIICLPNKVVVSIVGGEEKELDAVTNLKLNIIYRHISMYCLHYYI